MIDLRLSGYFGFLQVSPESAPSAVAAFLSLLVAIFTLTSKPSPLATSLRVAFCAISAYWFYRYGHTFDQTTRSAEAGVSIICAYGIFRNIETNLLEPLPRWITNGVPQDVPDTLPGRLMWSVDLLLSMRGTSFFANTHWDFVPAALIDKKYDKPRWTFVRNQLVSLLVQAVLMDFFDTTAQTQTWPTLPRARYPITTLSPLFQIYYAVCVCVMTALSMNINYTALSLCAVALGSPAAGWPPLFDEPFHATSLQEFWTHNWHASFRRVFLVISTTVVDVSKPLISNRRAQSAFRGLCIFTLSCIMHLGLMYRVQPPVVLAKDRSFIEGEIMLFFLLQPVGMLLEATLIKPLAVYAFGKGTTGARWFVRAWGWVWLVWTGRYWSDVWVRHGLWGPKERVVGYSLFRGLMHGNWAQ